jgi:hypothetical protein
MQSTINKLILQNVVSILRESLKELKIDNDEIVENFKTKWNSGADVKDDKKVIKKNIKEQKETCVALTKGKTRCKKSYDVSSETGLCAYHIKNGAKFGTINDKNEPTQVENPEKIKTPEKIVNKEKTIVIETQEERISEEDLFGDIELGIHNIDKCESEYDDEFTE